MTTMVFEGRTEREAVAKAAAELGSESFDVEVLERGGGLFNRGKVKIRVRPLASIPNPLGNGESSKNRDGRERKVSDSRPRLPETEVPADPPPEELVTSISEVVEGLIERMGMPGTMKARGMEGNKLNFEIESEFSDILIGKKGKNLNALQLLANVHLNKIGGDAPPWRIVLDAGGYRERREIHLRRLTHKVADEAVRSKSTRLLEPMNPFERRLVHTMMADRDDVETQSEGTGLYRRIRITATNASGNRSRKKR